MKENDFFVNSAYKLKLLNPLILLEDFNKMYYFDLNNKNVLDVGGLYGETAFYFLYDMGAKNVFVYEPIRENFDLIKINIIKNKVEKRIFPYEKGVSNYVGIQVINTIAPPGDCGFGLSGDKYSIKIPVDSWDTILERHKKDNIYLAKVDCEGGEKYLIEANKELIKTIPNWVIETHSAEIEKNIIGLFESLGYKKELRAKINKKNGVSVWGFFK